MVLGGNRAAAGPERKQPAGSTPIPPDTSIIRDHDIQQAYAMRTGGKTMKNAFSLLRSANDHQLMSTDCACRSRELQSSGPCRPSSTAITQRFIPDWSERVLHFARRLNLCCRQKSANHYDSRVFCGRFNKGEQSRSFASLIRQSVRRWFRVHYCHARCWFDLAFTACVQRVCRLAAFPSLAGRSKPEFLQHRGRVEAVQGSWLPACRMVGG